MSQANPFSPPSGSSSYANWTPPSVPLDPIGLLKRSYAMMGDQYFLFVGITAVGIILGSLVPFGILLGPMMVGIYLCYIDREKGKTVEFGTLFKRIRSVHQRAHCCPDHAGNFSGCRDPLLHRDDDLNLCISGIRIGSADPFAELRVYSVRDDFDLVALYVCVSIDRRQRINGATSIEIEFQCGQSEFGRLHHFGVRLWHHLDVSFTLLLHTGLLRDANHVGCTVFGIPGYLRRIATVMFNPRSGGYCRCSRFPHFRFRGLASSAG